MARAAVAQDDGFQQPRPAQPVYVVGVHPSRQQRLHDLDVAAFACGDQRRAAIAVGAFQVCAVAERQGQDLAIALRTRQQTRAVSAWVPWVARSKAVVPCPSRASSGAPMASNSRTRAVSPCAAAVRSCAAGSSAASAPAPTALKTATKQARQNLMIAIAGILFMNHR
ncbi:hypothetical protein G6F63_014599 [Rhizopus arrhizus]|nr:hypothetical protein G6F63_014599 [Rhizopus arrhizus]